MAYSGCRDSRSLIVFGNEIIDCEETISSSFLQLSVTVSAKYVHRLLRAILFEAGPVSSFFFPLSKASESTLLRAKLLRSTFDVPESSILQNRFLRNHLAHLDERLERWAKSLENRTFGRAMLGSRRDAARRGINDEDVLGLFDRESFVFCFQEDDLQVDELVGDLRRVSLAARCKLRDITWTNEAVSDV